MAYLELFDRVAAHVRRLDVEVMFKRRRRFSVPEIERARARAKIPIPSSMADFYAEVGDGLIFAWNANGDRPPFANHEFPKLAAVTLESLGTIKWRIEWKDDYDFRYTKDPTRAKQTALRMRQWMPFHDEGNGDEFCLDNAGDPAPVVFNQHDWFDGGTGENGHRLAGSLLEFYTVWSRVCFQRPSSLWWPNVFDKGGGVRWDSDEFRAPFRLPDGA